MNAAGLRRNIRSWLGGHPALLQGVFRILGKPYEEIAIFRALVRPGDTVFDIGANTGQYTSLFCRLVGPSGAVHAFEPIPSTFALMERNLARWKGKCRLELNNCALGESEGMVKMFVAKGRFTEASMAMRPAGEGATASAPAEEFDCRVTTADRYAGEHGIKNVALIKCDVEGAELLAMKGARGLLKNERPPILFLEAWSGWTKRFGYEPAELFDLLRRERGYEIYHVGTRGIERFSPGDKLPPDAFPDFLNFLCTVPSVHSEGIAKLHIR